MNVETTPAALGALDPIGGYRLVHRLATGGMGSVWLACRPQPGGGEELVAIKTLHPHLSHDPIVVDMFTSEARLASALDHPNVCRVFASGEADGTRFIVMEYLYGEPVSRVLERLAETPGNHAAVERLPLVAASVVAEAADGLHAAHELRSESGELLGLVHRDVAPDNLFVTYAGTAKLVDFGIARTREHVRVTVEGNLRGKIRYSAPERLRELPPDRRADVWSLGVCLWELLVRRPLFRGRDVSTLVRSVLEDPIVAPSKARPGLPPSLDDIVLRALQRPTSVRYQTAHELGCALREWLRRGGHAPSSVAVSGWLRELFPERKPPDITPRSELVTPAAPLGDGKTRFDRPARSELDAPAPSGPAPALPLGEAVAEPSTSTSAPSLAPQAPPPYVSLPRRREAAAPRGGPVTSGRRVVHVAAGLEAATPLEGFARSSLDDSQTSQTHRALPPIAGDSAPDTAPMARDEVSAEFSSAAPVERAPEDGPEGARLALGLDAEPATMANASSDSEDVATQTMPESDAKASRKLGGAPSVTSLSSPAAPVSGVTPLAPPEVVTGPEPIEPGLAAVGGNADLSGRDRRRRTSRRGRRQTAWVLAVASVGLLAGALGHRACTPSSPSGGTGSPSRAGAAQPVERPDAAADEAPGSRPGRAPTRDTERDRTR